MAQIPTTAQIPTDNREFTEYLFPGLVLLMSLGNIMAEVGGRGIDLASVSVSVLGLIAVTLFFLDKPIHSKLLYIWILIQIPAITYIPSSADGFTDIAAVFDRDILNLCQLGDNISLSFGVTFGLKGGTDLALNVSIIPFFYLIMLRTLKISGLKGKRAIVHKFRKDNKLGDIFPREGTIIRRANLSNENDWVFIQLDEPFQYKGWDYFGVLVKAKDDEVYKAGKGKKVSHLRLVQDVSRITDLVLDKKEFPFVDWGLVEVLSDKKRQA
jgi:hypothetical protein